MSDNARFNVPSVTLIDYDLGPLEVAPSMRLKSNVSLHCVSASLDDTHSLADSTKSSCTADQVSQPNDFPAITLSQFEESLEERQNVDRRQLQKPVQHDRRRATRRTQDRLKDN